MKEIFIVAAKRTPVGSFCGSLSTISAPKLGAIAIKSALDSINIKPTEINEVFMGNVLQAGIGQAPARQAAIFAGLNEDTPCSTINKVCASGMKAIMLGALSIRAGENECVVAGGMENMSLTPHYTNHRVAKKFGNTPLTDGIINDGLLDVYNQEIMGSCAESCAEKYNISREEQDLFSIESYKRAAKAWKEGKFKNEIAPVNVPQRKKEDLIISEDEEYKNVKLDKIPNLKPAFVKEGTITAANASSLNDGASALILMSKEKMLQLNIQPLAKIIGYADAAHEPKWFTTAPTKAINLVLQKTNLSVNDIDFWELNQAFSVVSIVNMKNLKLDSKKVDVNGGAVALGHPLGNSGSRIITTLINVLKQNNGKLGCAGICNGGGGASAMIIENI